MKLDIEWVIPLKNKKIFHYDSGQILAYVFQSGCKVSTPAIFKIHMGFWCGPEQPAWAGKLNLRHPEVLLLSAILWLCEAEGIWN